MYKYLIPGVQGVKVGSESSKKREADGWRRFQLTAALDIISSVNRFTS